MNDLPYLRPPYHVTEVAGAVVAGRAAAAAAAAVRKQRLLGQPPTSHEIAAVGATAGHGPEGEATAQARRVPRP